MEQLIVKFITNEAVSGEIEILTAWLAIKENRNSLTSMCL